MNKTALQSAIDYFEKDVSVPDVLTAYEVADVLRASLPIEREQIERAYDAGSLDVYFGSFVDMDITGKEYFTKTYEQ